MSIFRSQACSEISHHYKTIDVDFDTDSANECSSKNVQSELLFKTVMSGIAEVPTIDIDTEIPGKRPNLHSNSGNIIENSADVQAIECSTALCKSIHPIDAISRASDMSSIFENCTTVNTNPMYYIKSSEFTNNDFSINFVVAKFGNVLVKDYLSLHR